MRTERVGPAVAVIALLGLLAGDARGAQAPAAPDRAASGDGPAASPAERPPVEVRAVVNRTSASVGDPIRWTIELTCAPMVDVVTDDLAAETLTLEGLELVASDTVQTALEDGGRVYRMTFEFRTYEIDRPVLRVAPVPVRYFLRQPGQQVEDLEPAGQVDVPGVLVAWHSTIPEGLTSVELREERPADALPALLAVARPVGLSLVVVSFAPVAFWGVSRLRRFRLPRVRQLTARASRRQAHKALRELLETDTTTEAARRRAYAQLDHVLRDYLAVTGPAPARSLPLQKLTAWLEESRATPVRAAIAEALADCDRGCYGPAARVPSDAEFRERVALLGRLL